MTSLRNRLLPFAAALAIGAIAVSGCGSSSKTSSDTGSTTTTVESTVTTVAGATTTTRASATTTHTTAKPVTQTTKKPPATNPPATNPPTTAPQIITSFSVSDAYACTDPTALFQPPPPTVTVSWTVVGADSVNVLLDGGLWGSYGLSGSETLPASCDGALRNVHTYSVVAIKGGQAIATKSATRGH